MHVYRCEITLLEATFFSSREVSNTYQTEPLLGNIALAYAFGFCESPYHNDGTIYYKEHLSGLNDRGIYVTPGTFIGEPRFIIRQFNAQADAYWYAFANNVIVTRPDGAWARREGATWYIYRKPGERGNYVPVENRPQHGRIRMLSIGNRAVCFVISREPVRVPKYIRLGKFMSKAKVDSREVKANVVEKDNALVGWLLNPADLPVDARLATFDLISVPPSPLIRNSVISGRFYRLPGGDGVIPQGMSFNVRKLP